MNASWATSSASEGPAMRDDSANTRRLYRWYSASRLPGALRRTASTRAASSSAPRSEPIVNEPIPEFWSAAASIVGVGSLMGLSLFRVAWAGAGRMSNGRKKRNPSLGVEKTKNKVTVAGRGRAGGGAGGGGAGAAGGGRGGGGARRRARV